MKQNVIITGVSKGLGKELFDLFVSKDYFVYGILRNASDYKVLKESCPQNAKIILADLSLDESIDRIKDVVQDVKVDLLINNAGISGKEYSIQAVETEEVNDLFNIHCLGVVRTTKALSENLFKAQKAIILNLNSRFGSISRQANGTYENLTISYSYRIAKAAQNMLTTCLRLEFKNRVEVVSIHPGRMKTALAQSDADLEPVDVANRILRFYEEGKLKEVDGIIELDKEIIEW